MRVQVVAITAGGTSNATEAELTPETSITFESAQPFLKIKGEATAQRLFKQDFNIAELGIGGLDEQFSQIFRGAFASRAVPAATAKLMNIQHTKGILLYGPPGTGARRGPACVRGRLCVEIPVARSGVSEGGILCRQDTDRAPDWQAAQRGGAEGGERARDPRQIRRRVREAGARHRPAESPPESPQALRGDLASSDSCGERACMRDAVCTSAQVRELFADAERDEAALAEDSPLHVIIFDEIDAICRQRGTTGGGTGVHDSIVNTLLTKIDGVDSLNNILLIGAALPLPPSALCCCLHASLSPEPRRCATVRIAPAYLRSQVILSPQPHSKGPAHSPLRARIHAPRAAGMTNRPDLLDEALTRPGRIELKIEIGLPDEHGRLQILRIHAGPLERNRFLARDVSLESLAERTKNFTGAGPAPSLNSSVACVLIQPTSRPRDASSGLSRIE